jgi:hypothetical protein
VLLEHVDAAAWFGAALTPVGDLDAADDAPAPELLVAGRADLAPILQTPSAPADLGFPDKAGP